MRFFILLFVFLIASYPAAAQEAYLDAPEDNALGAIIPGSAKDGVRTFTGRIGTDTLVRVLRAKAIDAKNLDAQLDLCDFYGEKTEYAEALKWCQIAADRGDAEAQAKMGDMYKMGQGVATDPVESFNWYLFAAENGSERAQQSVASAYSNGDGVAQNNAEAWFWLSVTAMSGDATGKAYRDRLLTGLDAPTRDKIVQHYAAWRQKHPK